MNWLYYIAEANLYLGVFYLAYCIFLSKETHYQLNRGYLLASCFMALTVPLVQLGFLKPVEYLVLDNLPMAVTTPPAFTFVDALFYLYIIGVVFFAARFMLKVYQLKQLINHNTVVPAHNYKIVTLHDADTAFSFFNYLFVGTKTNEAALITRHELVHIRQKHSVDIVFVELFQIISWFNPAIYLLQNSLKTVHEYVADEQTARSETDTIAYATYLLNNAYGLSGPAITHSFFNYNLLKKRITMLHQKRSGNLARLKYLIAAPLCMGLLYQSTFGFDKTYGLINIAPKAPVTLQRGTTDTIPAKQREAVNVEQSLKGKVEGLNSQNAKLKEPVGTTIMSDGKTSEQVFVQDKNGMLIDFYSEEGKKIHAKNLAKEKAKGYMQPKKATQKTENNDNPDVPAANVEQLLDGKVRGNVIVKDREPVTDALNRNQGKVKGYNIQNGVTAADVTKIIQQIKANKPASETEIRITEPQPELRIEEPQQKEETRIDEPQQRPKKLATPQKPPLSPKKTTKKEVIEVTLTPPPPPPLSKDKDVKFPPPIVRPNKPAKTTKPVKFPPPIVKRDSK
jgi:hypothetical protein